MRMCRNSLRGSAICAFKMSDIVASFEGPYKEQRSSQSSWLPVRDSDVPDPHPAKVLHGREGFCNQLHSTVNLCEHFLNFRVINNKLKLGGSEDNDSWNNYWVDSPITVIYIIELVFQRCYWFIKARGPQRSYHEFSRPVCCFCKKVNYFWSMVKWAELSCRKFFWLKRITVAAPCPLFFIVSFGMSLFSDASAQPTKNDGSFCRHAAMTRWRFRIRRWISSSRIRWWIALFQPSAVNRSSFSRASSKLVTDVQQPVLKNSMKCVE